MSRVGVRSTTAVVLAVVMVLGLAGTGCTAKSSDAPGARNFYESLDLGSPSAAVETFTDAFARKDFMTVWLTFDIKTQEIIRTAFDLLQWRTIIDAAAVPEMSAEMSSVLSFDHRETNDRWYLFSEVMMIADRNDAYLIDLRGEVTLGDERPVGDGVEVSAAVAGIDGDVRFRLAQSPSGRWRIVQVIVPGGDETAIPWSVPSP